MPSLSWKMLMLACLLAFAEARFGQEQSPALALIRAIKTDKSGVPDTIAGGAISSLLAAADPCDKYKKMDDMLAQLGEGDDAVKAGRSFIASEQNFNPDAQKQPALCGDATLPANAKLRGVPPSVDPSLAGADKLNAASKAAIEKPEEATGKSPADLAKGDGFTAFITKDGNAAASNAAAGSSASAVVAPTPSASAATAARFVRIRSESGNGTATDSAVQASSTGTATASANLSAAGADASASQMGGDAQTGDQGKDQKSEQGKDQKGKDKAKDDTNGKEKGDDKQRKNQDKKQKEEDMKQKEEKKKQEEKKQQEKKQQEGQSHDQGKADQKGDDQQQNGDQQQEGVAGGAGNTGGAVAGRDVLARDGPTTLRIVARAAAPTLIPDVQMP